MSAQSLLRDLRHPAVVVAFEGWNDAGNVASAVLEHLADLTDAELAFAVDPDEYYDFTANRPMVHNTKDGRQLEWPTVEVLLGKLPDRDLVIIGGPEPNFKWNALCTTLISALRSVKPEHVICLGSMLADVPHRRPVAIAVNSTDYEGPTGIVGVFTSLCQKAGFPVTSLWASVPHYVSDPPNPKATLALLGRVEDVLDVTLDSGELPAEAALWQARVDELVADDPNAAAYIEVLEEQYDEQEPDELGDIIAVEAERFLRRRNR